MVDGLHDLLKGCADIVGGHPLAVFGFDDSKELLQLAAIALLHTLADAGVFADEGPGLTGEAYRLLGGDGEVHAWHDVLECGVDIGVAADDERRDILWQAKEFVQRRR